MKEYVYILAYGGIERYEVAKRTAKRVAVYRYWSGVRRQSQRHLLPDDCYPTEEAAIDAWRQRNVESIKTLRSEIDQLQSELRKGPSIKDRTQ